MMCDVMQYSHMVTLLFPSCVCWQVYAGAAMSGARLKAVDELQDVFAWWQSSASGRTTLL